MLGIFKLLSEYREHSGTDTVDRFLHAKADSNSEANSTILPNSPAAQRAIAHRYYEEIMNQAKLDVIDELMAPDFLFTIPTHPEPYRGPDGFKELVTMLHGAFPDVHLEVKHLLVDGNTVVGHWIGSGTHTGGALHTVQGDIPASGKHFVIDGVSWLKIVDGKIVESLANEDTLSLLHQIGVIPNPPILPNSDTNKKIAQRFVNEILNDGNFETVGEIIAPDFVFNTPIAPHPIRGPEGLKTFVTKLKQAFPDIHYQIDLEMGDDSMAAIRWLMTGTHQGEFIGLPPSNNSVNLQGVSIFEIVSGQITQIWVNANDLGLLEQIGAMGGA
ncbi:MAG: ester cyclase [Tildeniella torsiva UHER 1998/13D]|jgi:steroid delta-isomerase-like uncharacterized protein|nr:ester cyclase [Tildeniella torsiva UHER 1998/13D]